MQVQVMSCVQHVIYLPFRRAVNIKSFLHMAALVYQYRVHGQIRV